MLRHVELREVIGSNVKRYRKAAGLTQPALGQLCGLHKNTILNIEKGGTESVQLESLEAIARALRIDVDELFRAPVSEGDLPELVNRYRSSPWAQIDKPSDDELVELVTSGALRAIGTDADEEAVHHLLLAFRHRERT